MHNTATQPCEWCGSTNDECPCAPDDEYTGITTEGQAQGHYYTMGNINAYCPKCSDEHSKREGRPITALDCDYDLDK